MGVQNHCRTRNGCDAFGPRVSVIMRLILMQNILPLIPFPSHHQFSYQRFLSLIPAGGGSSLDLRISTNVGKSWTTAYISEKPLRLNLPIHSKPNGKRPSGRSANIVLALHASKPEEKCYRRAFWCATSALFSSSFTSNNETMSWDQSISSPSTKALSILSRQRLWFEE